jgi:hypothetical protein
MFLPTACHKKEKDFYIYIYIYIYVSGDNFSFRIVAAFQSIPNSLFPGVQK